jgi:hypothetical protein
MKVTKSKLYQIIREELEEAHASGGGGAGASYRRDLQRYAEWAARQDEKTKCQNLEAADGDGDPEARGLAQKIRCAWAAVLGGLTSGEPEEPLKEMERAADEGDDDDDE